MKRLIMILAVIVALFATMGTLNAQQKYAVIIGGKVTLNSTYKYQHYFNNKHIFVLGKNKFIIRFRSGN